MSTTQQPSLWDMPETQPSCIPVPAMGGTMEYPTRWADGDTCLEELERLARVVMGKLELLKANNGEWLSFRVIGSRVEGDHVVMTLRRIESPIKGYVQWAREQGQVAAKDDPE